MGQGTQDKKLGLARWQRKSFQERTELGRGRHMTSPLPELSRTVAIRVHYKSVYPLISLHRLLGDAWQRGLVPSAYLSSSPLEALQAPAVVYCTCNSICTLTPVNSQLQLPGTWPPLHCSPSP